MDRNTREEERTLGERMDRGRLRRRLRTCVLLSVGMMVLIFAFSSMDGGLSTSQSNGVAFWIAGHVIDGFEQMSYDQKLVTIHGMTYPIRKAAHVTEYAVLGGLLVATFWNAAQLRGWDRKPALGAWALGFACSVLYACTDEFHQTFVPGRTGQPTDVLIDSIGILAGSVIAMLIIRIKRNRERTER